MAWIDAQFYSMALGMQTTAQVFLPEPDQGIGITGAVWDGKTELPVLYLLHGTSDNSTIWMRRTSVERYNAGRQLAIVMPEAFCSQYADQKYGFNYYTYITEELPQIMNRFFRISLAREKNFIAGLSMGGYGTLLAALRSPEKYAKAAPMSIGITGEKGSIIAEMYQHIDDADFEEKYGNQFMSKFMRYQYIAFGTYDEYIKTDYYLPGLIKRRSEEKVQLPEIKIFIGTEDFLYDACVELRKELDQYGIPYTYHEGSGMHEWAVWDRDIQVVLDWVAPKAVKPEGATR